MFNASIVSVEISASSPPPWISASVASTPGPPALVTMARPIAPGTRLLRQHFAHVEDVGDGVHAQHADATERRVQNIVADRSANRCAKPQPSRPAAVRPALITMMGLVSETSRAADRNARASPIDSI